MTIWLVPAGQYGEWENLASEQGLSVIGWEELPDLAPVTSKEAMEALMRETYVDAGDVRIRSYASGTRASWSPPRCAIATRFLRRCRPTFR